MSDVIQDDGGPAFPFKYENHRDEPYDMGGGVVVEARHFAQFSGMTLRDYFAAKALVAVASMVATDRHQPPPGTPSGAAWLADSAYALADAMLKARSA